MIANVHALRGLASALVVLVHLTGSEGTLRVPRIGQGGVDVFFVISGFLMVLINRTERMRPMTFFKQRIARIVPFYWMMTIAVFTVALVRPSLLSATTASMLDLLRSLLFIPFVKSNGLMQPTLFVGWTLNYEMFFYALFAVSLLAKTMATGVAVTAGVLLVLTLAGFVSEPRSTAVRFYTDPILLEFLAGMLIALWVKPTWQLSPAVLALVGSGAALAMAVLILGPIVSPYPPVLVCGLPAALLVTAALVAEQSGWQARSPLLMGLGDASYAIYLTHPFAIKAIKLLGSPAVGPAWLTTILCFGGSLAAGYLVHRLIERPVSRRALRFVRGEGPALLAGRRPAWAHWG